MKITVDNLHVTYPARGRAAPVDALRGATLGVEDGELACVVGPSGCGKTTLLRVLAGLEQPTSGGYAIRHDDPARPRQGVVFQGAGLFPWLTVEQNVAYGLQMRGVAPVERGAVAREWIARIGLERFAHSYPAQLSGGMQQRVGLARAFAYGPEVLLMDEPFGALDAQMRLVLQQTLLEQIEREARAVLFITHSIEEALTLGDTIYVMSARPGRVLARFAVPFGRPRDAVALRSDPRFAALFAEIWAALRDEVQRARQDESEHDPRTAISR
jgi:NitT/TauT family transport system ATP-binding protein